MRRGAAATLAAGWLTAAAVSAAPAGPLDPGSVDRQATWVMHADARGLMDFAPAKEALADPTTLISRRLKRLQTDFGVDPRADLLGMTLYGLGAASEATVSVFTVSAAAADRIPGALEAAKLTGFRRESDGEVAIYTWVHRGEPTCAAVRPGLSPFERRVVIAASLGDIVRACRVLDAKQPSLVTPNLPAPVLSSQPRPGSLLFIAATGLRSNVKAPARGEVAGAEPVVKGPEALLFRSLETLTIDAGRVPSAAPAEGAMVYFSASATTLDEQSAEDCEAVVRGLIGMGCLAGRDNPDQAALAKVARGMVVSRNGSELRISTQQAAETIVQFVATLREPRDGVGEPVAGRQ